MDLQRELKNFEDLVASTPSTAELGKGGYGPEGQAWVVRVREGIEAVFPPGHAVRRSLDEALVSNAARSPLAPSIYRDLSGILNAAISITHGGRLVGLLAQARAETLGELLDQAEHLLENDFRAAAAIIAGGALETHLRTLALRAALSWSGDGTIAKYDQAIGQARNQGHAIYDATTSKRVLAWCAVRNDAAHSPGTFSATKAHVAEVIAAIREFVHRHP